MAKAKQDNQSGAWDRVITGVDGLEDALRIIDDYQIDPDFKEAKKAVDQAKKAVDQAKKAVDQAKKLVNDTAAAIGLQPGERARVGEYVITGIERRGGGFAIPAWTRTKVGDIEHISG